jgi:hypothetical protein
MLFENDDLQDLVEDTARDMAVEPGWRVIHRASKWADVPFAEVAANSFRSGSECAVPTDPMFPFRFAAGYMNLVTEVRRPVKEMMESAHRGIETEVALARGDQDQLRRIQQGARLLDFALRDLQDSRAEA